MNTTTAVTAHVTYRRDPDDLGRPAGERAWLVAVDDDERQHTYGWTLDEARRNIVEVVAMWHDVDERQVVLVEQVK